MRAGLVTGHRRFELVEMPDPVPRPGTAVVDIHLCGICGTDVHGFLGHDPYNPAICGHEWVGTVAALGSGVTGSLREGDRVIAAVATACGQCANCRAGRTAHCTTAFLGMVGRDPLAPPLGGFARSVAIDASRLIPAAGALSDEQAAMIEPTTVALHALQRTPPPLGATVVVQGCGPIGLLTAQLARARGAGEIIAVDPNAGRRDLAVSLGADGALTPEEAAERFQRSAADLVFECAGVPATVQTAVNFARQGGTINLVGLASGQATIDPGSWLRKEITLVASLGYLHHEFPLAMDLISASSVRVEPLHDMTVTLAELPSTMAALGDNPSHAVKVLVDPR